MYKLLDLSNEQKEPNQSANIDELVERIAALTLVEVANLNQALKKRLNIPDQPVFAAAAAAPAAASAG